MACIKKCCPQGFRKCTNLICKGKYSSTLTESLRIWAQAITYHYRHLLRFVQSKYLFQLKKRRSQSAHEVGIYSSSHDAHLIEDQQQNPCCPLMPTNSKQPCCPLMATNSHFGTEHKSDCCTLVAENGNRKLSTSPDIVVTRFVPQNYII